MAGCPRCSVALRRPASPPCPPSSSSPPPPPWRAGTTAGAACRRMPGSVVYLPLPPQQPCLLGTRIFPVTTKGVLRGGRLLGAKGYHCGYWGGQSHSSTALTLPGFSPLPIFTDRVLVRTPEVQGVTQKSSTFISVDILSGSLKGSGNCSLAGTCTKG